MASGQTANYGLNQWAAEDRVLREEFNRDNAKVDQLAAELSARIPRVVTGSFPGTGEESVTKHYDLGGRPKLVILRTDHEYVGEVHDKGMLLTDTANVLFTSDSAYMQAPGKDNGLEDSGFYILHGYDAETGLNYAGSNLHYWAWM